MGELESTTALSEDIEKKMEKVYDYMKKTPGEIILEVIKQNGQEVQNILNLEVEDGEEKRTLFEVLTGKENDLIEKNAQLKKEIDIIKFVGDNDQEEIDGILDNILSNIAEFKEDIIKMLP